MKLKWGGEKKFLIDGSSSIWFTLLSTVVYCCIILFFFLFAWNNVSSCFQNRFSHLTMSSQFKFCLVFFFLPWINGSYFNLVYGFNSSSFVYCCFVFVHINNFVCNKKITDKFSSMKSVTQIHTHYLHVGCTVLYDLTS